MKIKIKNIKLKYYKPIDTKAIKRKEATVFMVSGTADGKRFEPIQIQLESTASGSKIFFEPSWQFSNTNLKKLIKTTIKWDIQYEKDCREEQRQEQLAPEEDENYSEKPDWML